MLPAKAHRTRQRLANSTRTRIARGLLTLTTLIRNLNFLAVMAATRFRFDLGDAIVTRRTMYPCGCVPDGSNSTQEDDKESSDELHEKIAMEHVGWLSDHPTMIDRMIES